MTEPCPRCGQADAQAPHQHDMLCLIVLVKRLVETLIQQNDTSRALLKALKDKLVP